ncbi:hypothetical protein C9374_004514 [Naegleria lovaniensis]|uniref:Uncharacterized protein n=1 Tax=Naegleria lovaniensis TaxID=51637 RepID=A0AA88KJG0_NAELO|nr:uncharacterized protein C9374_004514 [Naegleria lovaniensis]KAG2383177.1 hypothetical protein C9374_004514 [Naegleria lovaniensis]
MLQPNSNNSREQFGGHVVTTGNSKNNSLTPCTSTNHKNPPLAPFFQNSINYKPNHGHPTTQSLSGLPMFPTTTTHRVEEKAVQPPPPSLMTLVSASFSDHNQQQKDTMMIDSKTALDSEEYKPITENSSIYKSKDLDFVPQNYSYICELRTTNRRGCASKYVLEVNGFRSVYAQKSIVVKHENKELEIVSIHFCIASVSQDDISKLFEIARTAKHDPESIEIDSSNTTVIRFSIKRSPKVNKRDLCKYYTFIVTVKLDQDGNYGFVKFALRHKRRDSPTLLYIPHIVFDKIIENTKDQCYYTPSSISLNKLSELNLSTSSLENVPSFSNDLSQQTTHPQPIPYSNKESTRFSSMTPSMTQPMLPTTHYPPQFPYHSTLSPPPPHSYPLLPPPPPTTTTQEHHHATIPSSYAYYLPPPPFYAHSSTGYFPPSTNFPPLNYAVSSSQNSTEYSLYSSKTHESSSNKRSKDQHSTTEKTKLAGNFTTSSASGGVFIQEIDNLSTEWALITGNEYISVNISISAAEEWDYDIRIFDQKTKHKLMDCSIVSKVRQGEDLKIIFQTKPLPQDIYFVKYLETQLNIEAYSDTKRITFYSNNLKFTRKYDDILMDL